MKSTQLFPIFTSLTEAQEVSLCGGTSNVVSYSNIVIIDKKGTKKQITKVVKTKTTKGTTSVSGLLKNVGINLSFLSSFLKFDW